MTHCSYYVQPGLFMGRAGLLLTAAALGEEQATVDDLVYGLGWHAMPFEGGLAYPGNQLLRLSMDLATGSAGVLLALGTALHDAPVSLPFLGPPQWSESLSRRLHRRRCKTWHFSTSRVSRPRVTATAATTTAAPR